MPEEPFIVHVGKPVPEGAAPPPGEGFRGGLPSPVAEPEVSGRMNDGHNWVSCQTCGLTYFVPDGYTWFTCAYGHMNYL